MKRSPLALVGALLTVAAAAFAGDFIAYQNALLARPVPPNVKAFCAGKYGASGGDYDACRVTRLFLADLSSAQDKGFPPMADIAYTTSPAESNALVDAMTKYSR